MSSIHAVEAQELKKWLDAEEAVVIDVREIEEYQAEYIPSAHNLPLSTVTIEQANLPEHKNKKLVMHCQLGKRGQMACEKLQASGATFDVWNLKGGIVAWKKAKLPTVCSDRTTISLQRQVQIAIGAISLIGLTLGITVNLWWLLLPLIMSLGLLNAGLTGWCGLVQLMSVMPWNKPKS